MKPLVLLALVLGGPFVSSAFAQSAALPFLNRVLNEHQAGGQLQLVDDPAQYAVFEALERQIRGLDKTLGNQVDLALLLRYQGDLIGQMIEALQRIRELTVQRINGLLSDFDRQIIDDEVDQQYDQILDDLGNVNFNGITVFRDLATDPAVRAAVKDAGHRNLASVDELLNRLNFERAMLGARASRLEFSMQGDAVRRENSQAAQGSLEFGAEAADFRKNQVLFLANLLMLKTTTDQGS